MIYKQRLIDDIKAIGVKEGDILNIKASLKSIGYVDGGAKTLIDALIDVVGETGTIITESFVSGYPLPVLRLKKYFVSDSTKSYAGALANAMVSYPNSVLSKHPLHRFCAVGYSAKELMDSHTPDSYAYDVLRKISERGGKNLKIGPDGKVVGVGTTHVAIGLLGLKQRIQKVGIYYLDDNNKQKLFVKNWSGGCPVGFSKFKELYPLNNGIIKVGNIGNAESQLSDMKKTLDLEMKILSQDPSFFMCKKCTNCKYSWEHSNGFAKNIVYFLFSQYMTYKSFIKFIFSK